MKKLLVIAALLVTAQAYAVSTTVVISEFRTRGPAGGNDEFIEIFNLSNAPVDISGWTLNGSSSTGTTSVRATVPASTTLPAGGYFLFTNSAAGGYSGSVAGDVTYATGIADNGGVALLNGATIIDQVGMSATSAYKEGTTLTPLSINQDQSFTRAGAGCTDTDNNVTDFTFATGSGPQNSASTPTPCLVPVGISSFRVE